MSTVPDAAPAVAGPESRAPVRAAAPYMNPYLAGIGLGLVLLAAYVVMGRGLGASGAVTSFVSWALSLVSPAHVKGNGFFVEYLEGGIGHPLKTWLVFEVLGVLAGRLHLRRARGPAVAHGREGTAHLGGRPPRLRLRRRRAHGHRRQARPRLHQRPGTERRRGAQRRLVGVHDDGVRGRLRAGGADEEAVAMNAPFYKFGAFGDEVSLVFAFVIGIGFGFFLERGGFGSARKLTSQFYLDDLAVFKVMFTAIVTAMLGLFYLSWLGLLDLSLVNLVTTNLWPQIVGGLVLGFGFVIGGYCPGTSLVAAVTGRIDGVIFILGVMAGVFVFGEAFPLLRGFYESGDFGELTLPQVFHLPYGLVVFLVVVMAVGGFMGGEWVERRFAPRVTERRP